MTGLIRRGGRDPVPGSPFPTLSARNAKEMGTRQEPGPKGLAFFVLFQESEDPCSLRVADPKLQG